uniref:Uncharacterized protein n=1 Tax=Solanum lycopersicum TaxID=4081 RepID=A0A3Q7IPM6_SOLLC
MRMRGKISPEKMLMSMLSSFMSKVSSSFRRIRESRIADQNKRFSASRGLQIYSGADLISKCLSSDILQISSGCSNSFLPRPPRIMQHISNVQAQLRDSIDWHRSDTVPKNELRFSSTFFQLSCVKSIFPRSPATTTIERGDLAEQKDFDREIEHVAYSFDKRKVD